MSEIAQTPEKIDTVEIRPAGIKDLIPVTSLALNFEQELREERGEAAVDADFELVNLRKIYSGRLSDMENQGLKHFVFMAVDTSKNKPIGFIVGHVPYPKPEKDFYALRRGRYVLPEYREKGISKQLANRFNEAVKEYGASHVEFEVQKGGEGHNYLAKRATFLKVVPEENGQQRFRYSEEI
jgi:GNAT superfamily N-acetyltransferase